MEVMEIEYYSNKMPTGKGENSDRRHFCIGRLA